MQSNNALRQGGRFALLLVSRETVHQVRTSTQVTANDVNQIGSWQTGASDLITGIGPLRGAVASFYGKVNYGKINALSAVFAASRF